MSKKKKLDVDKAKQLALIYKEKRHYAKQQFIEELISFQNFFGNTPIIGCELGLNRQYYRKTIKSVLKDLNYELYYYENIKPIFYNNMFSKDADDRPYSLIAFRNIRQ